MQAMAEPHLQFAHTYLAPRDQYAAQCKAHLQNHTNQGKTAIGRTLGLSMRDSQTDEQIRQGNAT